MTTGIEESNCGRMPGVIALVCAMLVAVVGCSDTVQKTATSAKQTVDAQTKATKVTPLSIVVIGLPEFGDEVVRQWAAKRDGELSIDHMPLEKFEQLRRDSPDLDLSLIHI